MGGLAGRRGLQSGSTAYVEEPVQSSAGTAWSPGRTTAFRPPAAARLGGLLEKQAHARPERLPAHNWERHALPTPEFAPILVVEVSADLALDGLAANKKRKGR